MATAINDLIVRLGAQTNAFDAKMRHSGGVLGKFRGAVGGLSRRLMGLSGIFLGLSAGGMAAMIKSNLDLIDATGKMSDRIGIATERLIGLRHAAELTGAGADTLDAGLVTMSKRLGEAARGAGAAKPALQQLGLSIEELIALSPDEQFRRIADAIARLPTQTERAAAAANIFSKGNMALINTLALGSEGLDEMQAEAERLGITFDRETARKAEDANDSLTRLGATIRGTLISAVADLSDEIKTLGDTLAKVPEGARKVRGGILRALGSLADHPRLAKGLFLLNPAGAAVAAALPSGAGQHFREEAARLEAGGGNAGLERKRQLYREWQARQRAEREAALRETMAGPAAAAFGWLNRTLGGGQAALRGGVGAAIGHYRQQQELNRQGRMLAEATRTPLEQYLAELLDIDRLWEAGAIDMVTRQRAIDQATATLGMQAGEPGRDAGDRFTAAMEKGSREAYSAILRATTEARETKSERKLGRIEQAIEEGNRFLETIAQDAGDVMQIPRG